VKILALPNGVNGAAYYRVFLPVTHLARSSDHQVTVPRPEEAGGAGGAWVQDQDVVVGHCIAHEGGSALWASWKDDAALVYECDDDLVNGVDERYHPSLVRYNDPVIREWHTKIIEMSDLVTVSTPVLAERMAKFNRNVMVLPNYVNGELLNVERPRRDRVTVGWQGSASHLGDMEYVSKPLKRWFRDNPAVDLHIMAADYRPLLGRWQPDTRDPSEPGQGRFTPWFVNMWDYYNAVDFDIGIAPLRPSAFNDAKSHIKCLEYAALGIPVVASDEPPYRDFVIDGVTGFLVRYDRDWGQRLTALVNDEAMRAEMGAKAREHAAAYTIQEHWPQWERAYASLLGEGTR